MIDFKLNWGIYERDIVYLGGTVEYTGEVIMHKGNRFERAVLTLKGYRCEACMKRFPDGNAAITNFIQNGNVLVSHQEYHSCYVVHNFIDTYYECIDTDEAFMICMFWRRTKQYLTAFTQGLCLLVFAFFLISGLTSRSPILPSIFTALCSAGLCGILGTFYKYYRNKLPKQ